MTSSVRATVLSGGHPFDGPAFEAMLASLEGVTCRHVPWPDALAVFEPGGLADTDVLVCYDMQGVGFDGTPTPKRPAPPAAVVEGWERLLTAGVPVVCLHHNIAAWPAWERYADIVGGRYHYVAASLHGVDWPDSGYRHNVHQTLTVAAPGHPVCAGVPNSFELTDETYLCPIFEDRVTPLLVSDAPKTEAEFYGTALALSGTRNSNEGWHHPDGSTLAGWTHTVERSTIVYLQPGDGPEAFGNPHYRTLLGNAIRWGATTRP